MPLALLQEMLPELSAADACIGPAHLTIDDAVSQPAVYEWVMADAAAGAAAILFALMTTQALSLAPASS